MRGRRLKTLLLSLPEDWTGGQIKNDNSAGDVKNVDLTQAIS